MRSNIVFFTLLLCILLANSKLLYRSASDISELHSLKQVGKQQKLVLFATTGFLTSSRGKRTIKSISDYIQSINYNDNLTGVVNIDFNDEIKLLKLPSSGLLSIFAYYVDDIHFQGGDSTKLVADLSVYFEEIVRHTRNAAIEKKRSKVVMILGARSQQTEENALKMKILLQDSINEAWSLVPKILIDKFHSIDDYLEIKLIDENPELFPLIKDMIENNNFIAESTISNNIHNPNNKNLTNIESLHIYDVSVANDYFFSGLTNKINEIHINETISMNEINAYLDNLNRFISEYNTNINLNELLLGSSLHSLRTRARLCLSTNLYSFYVNIVQAIRLNTISAFDTAVKGIKPNTRLPQSLDSLVNAHVKNFDDTMQTLKDKFENIINVSSNNGIFTNQSRLSKDQIKSLFSYKNELNNLYEKLITYRNDRQLYLFTQGAYNPYIRDKPYPPFKINLSYLFNPNSVLFNIDYNKLYDEHKEGPVLNRADALLIPNVATFPFDPNDRAVPKENRKWYQILVDLYLN